MKLLSIGEIREISRPYLLFLNVFLFSTLILSTRLATFLHEVLGHGISAVLMGGEVSGIRMSLFGGGNAYYHFANDIGIPSSFAVAFGGILINLLTGASALFLAGKSGISRTWAMFLSVFGMISISGALAYACLGFYHEVGDPVAWVRGHSPLMGWLWVPFLAASPLAAYFGVRSFIGSIRQWFSVRRFTGKLVLLTLTLGFTVTIYTCLYLFTAQRSVALEIPSTAYARAEESIRQEKRIEIARQLRKTFPEWTENDLARALERLTIEVRPEEIPRTLPIVPILILSNVLGALLALRSGAETPPLTPPISSMVLLTHVALASLVLGLLLTTNGWIYRAS